MDVWGWLAVYVVGLVAFQLLVFRYMHNGEEVDGRTSPGGAHVGGSTHERVGKFDDGAEDDAAPSGSVGAGPVAEAGATRRCSRCGAQNEPDRTFSLCWNCAARLE